ncbi:MAG: phosphatidate cytidylyltransferase [Lachnospiraceae bacterium]|nr:phosphatidate cytidylyltransferase [Lachnospiraceae bacterium]
MFKTRLISGIVLVIIALVLIITGGDVLLCSMGIVSCIGMFELYRVFKIEKNALGYAGYVVLAVYYLDLKFHFIPDMMMLVIGALMLILAVYVFSFPKYHANQMMAAFLGVIYVGMMISYVYLTRMLPMGSFFVWLIFLSSWGCDTCAYCAGRLFGKHKMAPILSPKKTVEGAVGGVIGSVLLTLLYGLIMKNFFEIDEKVLLIMMVATFIGSFISMVGDLAASAIKRNYEVKDYGTLIPGHGGILDRFDSVFFTAPIIYYIAVHLLK